LARTISDRRIFDVASPSVDADIGAHINHSGVLLEPGQHSGRPDWPGGTCASIVVRLSRIRSSASTSSRPRRVPRPAPRSSWPNWPTCATGGHLRRGVRAGEGQGPFGLNSWPPWAVCAAGPDGPGKQEPAALHTRIRSSCAAACLTAGGWAQAPPARASGVPRHRGYRASQPKTACSPEPDWLGSGRRIMRNEMSSPVKPARIGIRSAT